MSDKIIEQFRAKVKATAARYRMWQQGDRVLVAVSGGPDSVALLDAMVALAPEARLWLAAAHFNHGLRGPQADEDARYVQELAGRYGIEVRLGKGNVRAEAARQGRGLEAAARTLRLRFLQEQAKDLGCQRLALGHTASDRAETVLLNLLRGTGLAGLQGIAPARPPFVRPLVELTRAEVEAYCTARGLQPRLDRTNLDPATSLRNKVRHELLPLLEREYRAGATEALLRCARAVEDELRWTEPLVEGVLREAVEVRQGRARVRLGLLQGLPEGLVVRVLRRAAAQALGSLEDWAETHFRALARAVQKAQTGHRVLLPGGIEGRVAYGWLELVSAKPVDSRAESLPPRPLPVPGEVELPEAGARITARVMPATLAPSPGPCVALLRADLAGNLVVRGWQAGDRFFPLGAPGRKKLQDFFVDAKVPREQRGLVPLVIHPREGIIWVAGMRISQPARVEAGAREVLVLRMEA